MPLACCSHLLCHHGSARAGLGSHPEAGHQGELLREGRLGGAQSPLCMFSTLLLVLCLCCVVAAQPGACSRSNRWPDNLAICLRETQPCCACFGFPAGPRAAAIQPVQAGLGEAVEAMQQAVCVAGVFLSAALTAASPCLPLSAWPNDRHRIVATKTHHGQHALKSRRAATCCNRLHIARGPRCAAFRIPAGPPTSTSECSSAPCRPSSRRCSSPSSSLSSFPPSPPTGELLLPAGQPPRASPTQPTCMLPSPAGSRLHASRHRLGQSTAACPPAFRGLCLVKHAPLPAGIIHAYAARYPSCSGSSANVQIGNVPVCLALTLATVVMALLYMPVTRSVDSTLLQVGWAHALSQRPSTAGRGRSGWQPRR